MTFFITFTIEQINKHQERSSERIHIWTLEEISGGKNLKTVPILTISIAEDDQWTFPA